jgi:hypothetical protein
MSRPGGGFFLDGGLFRPGFGFAPGRSGVGGKGFGPGFPVGSHYNPGLRFFGRRRNRSGGGFLFYDNHLTAFTVIRGNGVFAFPVPPGACRRASRAGILIVFCPFNEFYLWFLGTV